MKECDFGTFLPSDTGSKKLTVFLLTSSLIAKWLEEIIVLKLEETSFMGKTSLWLCVFKQIGLNLPNSEVKRHQCSWETADSIPCI